MLTADYKTSDEAQKAIAEKINEVLPGEVSADCFSQGGQHQGLRSPNCSASTAPRSSPT